MPDLVPPHGGKLTPLLVSETGRKQRLKEAETLPKVRLNSKELSDIIMLAMGAFSPLEGFMGEEDYRNVVKDMHTKDGLLWPIPITLAASKEESQSLKEGQKVPLYGGVKIAG